MIHESLQAFARDITTLVCDERNARMHSRANLEAIKASLVEFGQVDPLHGRRVGDAFMIMIGNGRLQAARELGWTEIAVLDTSDDDYEARRLALAHNRSAELASWDRQSLANELSELADAGLEITGLGWNPAQIKSLMDYDPTVVESVKSWDASELVLRSVFAFEAPFEYQARIRAVLAREFPEIEWSESIEESA